MRTKNKENTKVPKSAKTRLSDLTPKKDARGGMIPTPPVIRKDPPPTPPYVPPPKKQVTL